MAALKEFSPSRNDPLGSRLCAAAHDDALINPSRFEGWSTTVEEAKSFGVPMILSDIDVHREQTGGVARYFGTDDPEALANHLSDVSQAAQPMVVRDLLPDLDSRVEPLPRNSYMPFGRRWPNWRCAPAHWQRSRLLTFA